MPLAQTKQAVEEVLLTPDVSEEICDACSGVNRSQCVFDDALKLSEFKPGDSGTVVQVCGNPDFRLRMMEMGFVKGTRIQVVKYAPLTDPIEFVIKGYHLSLRRTEAANILMHKLGEVA